ncbi:TPA: hypothetical protein U0C91_002875, partial [Listeria monocytogenes]|nr:hypothetical protein [Listeria monocytogenes]HEL8245037.1 hypothetical protein [Listeria monocytogenes]
KGKYAIGYIKAGKEKQTYINGEYVEERILTNPDKEPYLMTDGIKVKVYWQPYQRYIYPDVAKAKVIEKETHGK